MNMPLSQQNQGASDGPIMWPSIGYYVRALMRQAPVALLCTLPVLALILIVIPKIPKEYSSRMSVVYDTDEGTGERLMPPQVANTVDSLFTSSFTSPLYLDQVLEQLPPEMKEVDEHPSGIKAKIGKLLPPSMVPTAWVHPTEEDLKNELRQDLSDDLTAENNVAAFSIGLTATDHSPEAAQIKARAAMKVALANEIKRRRKLVQAKIQELSEQESKYLKEKEETPSISTLPAEGPEKSSVPAERKKELKDLEQMLVKDLLNRKAEWERSKENSQKTLFDLESQLNNLLSRKGPDHPEVVAKSREIDKFRANPPYLPIEQAMEVQKKRLSKIQKEMNELGLPVDRSVQIAFFSSEMQRTLQTLTGQLRAFEVVADAMNDDIVNPFKSQHFTISRDAELPSTPSNKKKVLMAAGLGAALMVLFFFAVVVSRELYQPYIVDAEQLELNYGLPGFRGIRVSRRALRAVPTFDDSTIQRLKPQLEQLARKRRPDLILFDAYRHIEQLIDQTKEHQVTTVYDLSSKNHKDKVAFSLAQILSTKTGRKVLFLSFRNRPGQSQSTPADLMDFISGKVEWGDVRFKSDSNKGLDQAFATDAGKTLNQFQEEQMRKLFKLLREKYAYIVIDALPPVYNLENGLLHDLSDTVVLQVRLKETQKTEMSRVLQFLESDKLAASIIN